MKRSPALAEQLMQCVRRIGTPTERRTAATKETRAKRPPDLLTSKCGAKR